MIHRRPQQHQLRFNTPYSRRSHQILHNSGKQRIFVRRRVETGAHIKIPDEAFALVADLIRIACQLIANT
jgi:hypothetical protein